MIPEAPQLVPSDPEDEPHWKQLFEVVCASDQVPQQHLDELLELNPNTSWEVKVVFSIFLTVGKVWHQNSLRPFKHLTIHSFSNWSLQKYLFSANRGEVLLFSSDGLINSTVMKQMSSSTTVWLFGVSRKYAISSWVLHYVMTPTFISNTI